VFSDPTARIPICKIEGYKMTQNYYNPKRQDSEFDFLLDQVMDDAHFALAQLKRKSSKEEVLYPDKYFDKVFEDRRSKRKN
jgi:hypothetical protein